MPWLGDPTTSAACPAAPELPCRPQGLPETPKGQLRHGFVAFSDVSWRNKDLSIRPAWLVSAMNFFPWLLFPANSQGEVWSKDMLG